MRFLPFFPSTFNLLLRSTAAQPLLNLTAIAARDNASILQCWQLTTPPTAFAGATNYPLTDSTGAYVGVIAPRTHIGQAWAPHVQFSLFLSGLGHISLPGSKDEVWVRGGQYGMVIAADTRDVSKDGHVTDFPGADTTVIAQWPCAGGVAPEHVVLHDGPCGLEDMLGL